MIEEEVHDLFKRGLLDNNDAVILLHHFGYETLTVESIKIERAYKITFDRLSNLNAQRILNRSERRRHVPTARMYLLKMIEGRYRPSDLAKLQGAIFNEEQIEQLLAVGLSELLDDSFD